jgi:predicted glutamine amidotransferase
MCRLFGMLSVVKKDAVKYLIDAECSIFRQSNTHDNRKQSDGWGIGYYQDRLQVLKSTAPVYTEKNKFINYVRNSLSSVVVVHIRKASNPKNLPRDKLISIENIQPFHYGNMVFIHNGSINVPDDVIGYLKKYKVKGLNDSETYFWLLMENIDKIEDIPKALRECDTILHMISTKPYSALNCIVSDGLRIYAYCKYIESSTQKSLCYKDRDYFTMCYKIVNDTELIISSERIDSEGVWHTLNNDEILVGEIRDDAVITQIV